MSLAVPSRFNVTIGVKIYALIAMTSMGLIGVTVLASRELAASLKQQKQIEMGALEALNRHINVKKTERSFIVDVD